MNILPFVLGFILLFAIGIDLLFHKEVSLRVLKKGVESHFKAVYRAESKGASKKYEQKKTQPSDKKGVTASKASEQEERLKKHTIFFRDKKPTRERQKFNLALLKEKSAHTDQLKSAALELIKKMYEKTSFYTEGMEQEILQALLEETRDHPLFSLKNHELDALFYQMQRGTSTYDLKKQQGFPSFWDYFTVNSNSKLDFLHLSGEALESILGKQLTEKIFEKEREKKKALTLEELRELLIREPGLKTTLPHPQAFFRFSKEGDKNKLSIDDQESGLLIRK